MRARRALAAAALPLAICAAGCGGNEPAERVGGSGEAKPGGGGTLVYALSRRPSSLDPFYARSRGDQTVSAQSFEPLVASLSGPFGDTHRRRGLAASWRSSADRQIWSFTLRRRIRFQDGSVFNAAAILANAARWRSTAAGRDLIPGLVAADAPSPSEVRFVLDRATPGFPRLLATPRLGIVAPSALRHRTRAERVSKAGTGPFELRQEGRDGIALARSGRWWGSRLGLGPALDHVRFRIVPSERHRVQLLRRGDAQVAASLGAVAARRVRRDPLLLALRGAGGTIGLERSVRGIEAAGPVESFAGVWLTTVGPG